MENQIPDNSLRIDEIEKEFYYCLGVLSTKFSNAEYNLLSILGQLVSEDFVLSNTLLERNSLSQNIDLLKKVIRYKDFKAKEIQEINERLSKVRRNRNLFIHGIWGKPHIHYGEVRIACREPRIEFREIPNGKQWSPFTLYYFTLSEISQLILELDSILELQKILLDHLKAQTQNGSQH